MATNKEKEAEIIGLIEDGELDDSLGAIVEAIDDRNARRKDVLLRQIKGVWGEEARVVTQDAPLHPSMPSQQPSPASASVPQAPATEGPSPRQDYVPDAGPQIPAAIPDPTAPGWPTTPMVSAGMGEFTAVPDPMAAGPGE